MRVITSGTIFILLLCTVFQTTSAKAQSIYNSDALLELWPERAPLQMKWDFDEVHERTNKLRISNIHTPTIEIFLPQNAGHTTPAVVMFPGGGYSVLVYEEAGTNYAEWLNKRGIAGIVVKYRLPDWEVQSQAKFVPLIDAQRALRMVRYHSEEWNIDPDRIGIMGSSAGGHLASSLSTLFSVDTLVTLKDSIQSISARPNFSILVYPVISMYDPYAHKGSRRNLLTENFTEEDQAYFSTFRQVSGGTPPTFIIHSSDDKSVSVENSIQYYTALIDNGISSTMHVYQDGGHGFGMGNGQSSVQDWLDVLDKWLQFNGYH